MAADPPFRSVAIVGLGLIGGSLALATRETWPAMRVTGVDSESVLAHVRGSGAIDRSASSLAEVRDVDLVVLAAPVKQNLRLLGELRTTGPVVVTDVGSTKRAMVEAGAALAPPVTFVGGHPLGGAERGGFAFARADLFAGRPWIFTPSSSAHDGALEGLTAWVAGFGARPTTMSAIAHDELMASISHLPQMVASALMAVVGQSVGAEGVRLAGRGLIDSTRLASSPANVWRDVCETNADALGVAIDAFIDRLTSVRERLRRGEHVDDLFEDAARWRAELMKGRE